MTDLSSILLAVLRSLLLQSPVIVTALVGCILVIIHWRALRRAALPAILGLGLFAGLSVFVPVIWAVVPRMMAHDGSASWETVFAVLGLINALFYALALGLIITAVVVGRSQTPPAR